MYDMSTLTLLQKEKYFIILIDQSEQVLKYSQVYI